MVYRVMVVAVKRWSVRGVYYRSRKTGTPVKQILAEVEEQMKTP